MNAPTDPTACGSYEHEIADLVDGLLSETETHRVRAHLATCAHCRAWHAEYAATDALLQSALPQPTLSPAFEASLKASVQALQTNHRQERRAAADAEHDALLATLRRDSKRNAALGAIGAVTAAGCSLVLIQQLLQHDTSVQAAVQGADRLMVFGGIGAVIAAGVIGWSVSRSAFVSLRFVRW
jgi:anti-sigma factor RsiW